MAMFYLPTPEAGNEMTLGDPGNLGRRGAKEKRGLPLQREKHWDYLRFENLALQYA